jgi:hypothetical protein
MKSFAKDSSCPASHQILSYVEGSLRTLARQKVARHCNVCDFCGAEAQLFSKYQPSEDRHVRAPRPSLITVLGITLPMRRAFAVPARRAA